MAEIFLPLHTTRKYAMTADPRKQTIDGRADCRKQTIDGRADCRKQTIDGTADCRKQTIDGTRKVIYFFIHQHVPNATVNCSYRLA